MRIVDPKLLKVPLEMPDCCLDVAVSLIEDITRVHHLEGTLVFEYAKEHTGVLELTPSEVCNLLCDGFQ